LKKREQPLHRVIAFAPASISNLGSGFDVIGLALQTPGDYIEAERIDKRGVRLAGVDGDDGMLPRDARRNVATYVASLLLKDLKPKGGVAITVHKRMPAGSGLGSSAASSVAAAVAVNALFGNPLTKKDLLPYAIEGERFVSGTGHPDNVSPSLFGGVTLIRDAGTLDVVQLPIPRKILWVVVHPHIVIRTAHARKILPRNVPLAKAVYQWGNLGGLVAGFCTGNLELIGRSIEDVIVEPVRARLIPGFRQVKSAALEAGALACSISGSGPSIFALVQTRADAKRVGGAMQKAFRQAALKSDLIISCISEEGARLLSHV
jgi:homoserine kinase